MNNPINTKSFKHWLIFKSLGRMEPYRIAEPYGFKAENFIRAINDERFSCDIFFSNEQAPLIFKAGSRERSEYYQIVNPNGRRSKFLDMGLNWILETHRRFGFEGEIERIIEFDGQLFTIGILDMSEPDTDGATYYGCNVIQNKKVSNYKKQITTSVDVLSTQNIKGEPITPAPTLKFLRRAVPVTEQSQWSKTAPSDIINFGTNVFMCLNRNTITSGIKNTKISTSDVARYYAGGWQEYTFAQWDAGGYDFTPSFVGRSMKLGTAKKLLTNVQVNVKFKGKLTPHYIQPEIANFYYAVMVCSDLDFVNYFNLGLYTKVFNFQFPNTGSYDIDINQTITLPDDVPMDKNIYGFFTMSEFPLNDSIVRHQTYVQVKESLVTVIASEVSLDTVISGVRYIDMIKQNSKFINDTPVVAPIFDVGGEHYNNVCYNRALLSIETSNSLELINDITPDGSEFAEVVYNTNGSITGVLPVGYYFWNGFQWKSLDEANIQHISLTDSANPPGNFEGELAFNDSAVDPVGLCYWNGTNWNGIQYTRPFITTPQDCFEHAMTIETCSDYEIQENKISFLPFNEFFTQSEIASFVVNKPSKTFKEYWRESAKLNNIKFGFSTYETNRLSKNTANDIHTEAEWNVPNEYVENKFERTINYIRSGYSAQAMDDLETKTPQTADVNDDKVFITKIIELPADEVCQFGAKLFMQSAPGVLTVLNRNSDGDEGDVSINWRRRGFSIGQSFQIILGSIVNNYTIAAFTNSLLTLTPVGSVIPFSGDTEAVFKYTYTGVEWQTMTDQGYTIKPNTLENPSKQPNLDYTLARIFNRWQQWFKSSILTHTNLKIKNLAYKNNPPLVSQAAGGIEISEKGTIDITSMPDPILDAKVYEFETYAPFGKVLQMFKDLLINRGFIRGIHLSGRIIKGYPVGIDYTWYTGKLKFTLWGKFEPDVVRISVVAGKLFVNDTPYQLSGVLDWYKISADGYFQCFDIDEKAICDVRHFSKVEVAGTIYTTPDDLRDALERHLKIIS